MAESVNKSAPQNSILFTVFYEKQKKKSSAKFRCLTANPTYGS
jgi:hypothetical protein